MLAAIVLLGIVLCLLFVLELLNAFYDAMLSGQVAAWKSEPKTTSLLKVPLIILRWAVLSAMLVLRTVSLWFHELSHALAQLLSGGMPRVVMCRGGGYAQARSWPIGRLGHTVHFYGRSWGNFLSPMAPLLFGATVVCVALWWTTPLRGTDTVSTWMSSLAHTAATPETLRELPGTARAIGRELGVALWQGGAVAIGVVVAISMALASSLTPSSTDFGNARWALPGFLAGVVASAGALDLLRSSVAVLAGAGLCGLLVYSMAARRERHWNEAFGAFGATCLGFAVAASLGALPTTSSLGVVRVVAALVLLLSVAAMLYVGFLALMLALTVLSMRVAPLWEGIKAAPGAIRNVFAPIATCKEKRIMFQDRCDYCQCSVREFKRNGCGGKQLDRPRKTGIRGMLRRLAG